MKGIERDSFDFQPFLWEINFSWLCSFSQISTKSAPVHFWGFAFKLHGHKVLLFRCLYSAWFSKNEDLDQQKCNIFLGLCLLQDKSILHITIYLLVLRNAQPNETRRLRITEFSLFFNIELYVLEHTLHQGTNIQERLLNKPHVNEVTLTGQTPSLKRY